MAPELREIKEKLIAKPHKSADEIFRSITEAGEGIGEELAKFLDSLPLGKKGPHRAVDDLLDGIEHGFEEGSKEITKGLDQPFKEMRR